MGDEEEISLEDQFGVFSKLMDNKRDGLTITLYRSDYWMRQARILDDRKLTMTDTGIAWFKYSKTELEFAEWKDFLTDVCQTKNLDQEFVEQAMTYCGTPGTSPVTVPIFREYFDTYKPKEKLPA